MQRKTTLNRAAVINAVRDAQLASGNAWICVDDISKLLPAMEKTVLQATLKSTQAAGFLRFNGSGYAIRTTLNRSEQLAYAETLKACQQLGRPVALFEIKTVGRETLWKQMSRLVYKGYLRQSNGRYTPTRQAHATPAVPLAATKRPRKTTVAKAPRKTRQGAALSTNAQQDAPSLGARLRALAAALIALFVRP